MASPTEHSSGSGDAKEIDRNGKVKAIFDLFDEDEDGHLKSKEFMKLVNTVFMTAGETVNEKDYPKLAESLGANPEKGVQVKHVEQMYSTRDVEADFKRLKVGKISRKKKQKTQKIAAAKEKKVSKERGELKSGIVFKRGEINPKYKARFMKLEEYNGRFFLVYYKQESDTKPSGQILLENARVELDSKKKRNWRIKTTKRNYFLKSASEEERRDWCLALANHCSDALDKFSVLSLGALGTYASSSANLDTEDYREEKTEGNNKKGKSVSAEPAAPEEAPPPPPPPPKRTVTPPPPPRRQQSSGRL
mmetsp:Transcript_11432/g.17092  ORF Transcript_11432/g.17092 Transcript_11432/m.17092 type:complete len:306 (+) Transcript_11432:10-927(+)